MEVEPGGHDYDFFCIRLNHLADSHKPPKTLAEKPNAHNISNQGKRPGMPTKKVDDGAKTTAQRG